MAGEDVDALALEATAKVRGFDGFRGRHRTVVKDLAIEAHLQAAERVAAVGDQER